jgi:hypothetical protein
MASRMIYFGNGFWNLRDSFVFFGCIDIGTHMAFIQLSSGKYVVIDTCKISAEDKTKIDQMTNNGALIEAVIATHAFHTVYFEPFHKMYPNVPFYGTPRHIKNITSIPWAGSVAEPDFLTRYESENIFMRIPEGADFVPTDENNHFSGLFIYHQPSRTIFNDDTIMFFNNTGCILRCLVGNNKLDFWNLQKGLRKNPQAPREFERFIEGILNDWDFDNLCLAHTSNKLGGAKEALRQLLTNKRPEFDKLANKKY